MCWELTKYMYTINLYRHTLCIYMHKGRTCKKLINSLILETIFTMYHFSLFNFLKQATSTFQCGGNLLKNST